MVIKTPPSCSNAACQEQTRPRTTQFIDTDDSTLHSGAGQVFFLYLNTLFCLPLRRKSRIIYVSRSQNRYFSCSRTDRAANSWIYGDWLSIASCNCLFNRPLFKGPIAITAVWFAMPTLFRSGWVWK